MSESLIHTRNSYSIEDKLRIIHEYETTYDFNATKTAKMFQINRTLITKWYHKKCEFQNICNKKMHKVGGGMKCYYPDLEKLLFQWITDQISQNLPVKYNKIRAQAQFLAMGMPDLKIDPLFKYSNNWIRRFCLRHKIPNVCKASHRLTIGGSYETLNEYSNEFDDYRGDHNEFYDENQDSNSRLVIDDEDGATSSNCPTYFNELSIGLTDQEGSLSNNATEDIEHEECRGDVDYNSDEEYFNDMVKCFS